MAGKKVLSEAPADRVARTDRRVYNVVAVGRINDRASVSEPARKWLLDFSATMR
jgi:hypothetical protein